MKDEDRLNYDTERRLDSMALVVLLFNDNNILIPAPINEQLDTLGVIMLQHFKKAKGFTSEQTNEALLTFTAMMEEKARSLKQAGVRWVDVVERPTHVQGSE